MERIGRIGIGWFGVIRSYRSCWCGGVGRGAFGGETRSCVGESGARSWLWYNRWSGVEVWSCGRTPQRLYNTHSSHSPIHQSYNVICEIITHLHPGRSISKAFKRNALRAHTLTHSHTSIRAKSKAKNKVSCMHLYTPTQADTRSQKPTSSLSIYCSCFFIRNNFGNISCISIILPFFSFSSCWRNIQVDRRK